MPAERKRGFLLYTSIRGAVDKLSDEDAGALFKGVLSYVDDGTMPELSPIADVAFTFIKDDVDRANEAYDAICERNRANGKNGGRPRSQPLTEKPKEPSGFSGNPEKPKETLQEQDQKQEQGQGQKQEQNTSPPCSPPEGEPPAAGVAGKRKRFIPPTVDEVRAYCLERNNGINPQASQSSFARCGKMRGRQQRLFYHCRWPRP